MKAAAWLLVCAGFILSSSSIADEECRYDDKPPYRSFILEGYSEASARHYFDTADDRDRRASIDRAFQGCEIFRNLHPSHCQIGVVGPNRDTHGYSRGIFDSRRGS